MSTSISDATRSPRGAVDLLMERINEKGSRRPARTITSGFRIIVRESTAGNREDGPPHGSPVSGTA